jgi:branched-chain amino acid transport system ATP-binding protein
LLNIDKLSVSINNIKILNSVSLSIERGESVAILGPNGAGKTTLCKTIMGLFRPDDGTIIYNGHRIDGYPPYKISSLGISLIPERANILSESSVHQNLLIGATRKDARKKSSSNLKEIYELFPVLYEKRNQKAYTLSGGQRQILAIARALMNEPDLVVIDEPSQGLSQQSIYAVAEAIKRLIRDRGKSILICEQTPTYLNEIVDRLYIMVGGRIVREINKESISKGQEIWYSYVTGE